uniref:prolyl aminopeptidase n=1 Tax=viral metagenome TaxID=1070528 RepID=A0A6C0BR12_9ZZZZ
MVKVYYIEKRSDTKKIKDLNADINNKIKVVCLIYLNGCPACESVSGDWLNASKIFKKVHSDNNIAIAYINRDALPDIDYKQEVFAFPHFSTITGKNIKNFEPDRSESGLIKFMEEQSENEKVMTGGKKKPKRKYTQRKNKHKKKITQKNKKDMYYYNQSKMITDGYIKTGIHSVYYSCYGNKNGKPVLVVHGGPGAPPSPKTTRMFNPKKYFIVLIHQRGCGKSTPTGELKANNTHELINDFEKIRKKLNINKWMLLGGSWGSFLSLVYAIKYPGNISEIIVSGIFLGGKDEVDWVNSGTGANYFFPKEWEEYIKQIPINERDNLIQAYGKRFEGELGNKVKNKALYNWAKWEESVANLEPNNKSEIIKSIKKNDLYKTFAMFEYHYFKNNCFVPKNYLKNKEVYKVLKNIPVEIIHGRYDMICPAYIAYDLHKYIPHSNLYFTTAGHSSSDIKNRRKIIEITDKYV